jgi:hypothetical protein
MAAINNHHLTKQINGPVSSGAVISPDDATDLVYETRGIYIGVAGNLTVTLAQDQSKVTFTALSIGVIHPIAASRVWATGTTATGILGVY